MKYIWGVILAGLCAWSVAIGNTQAEPATIQVLGNSDQAKESRVFVLTPELLQKNAVSYTTQDLSFPKDPAREFRGISITKVAELAGFSGKISGAFFIAKNQYLTYEPWETLQNAPVMIAFEMNGKEIKANRGGPYKVIYPPEVKRTDASYNWYIHTLVFAETLQLGLELEKAGNTQILQEKEIQSLASSTQEGTLPFPRSFLPSFSPLPSKLKLRGIPLHSLMEGSAKEVIFSSFVGTDLTLTPSEASAPIMVLTEVNEQPIKVMHGGPYSVIFPVEQIPALKAKVPNGAFFFLKKITIR